MPTSRAGIVQRGGDVLQAQAGGVGRQHGIGPHARFQAGQQSAFGWRILEDGLDHHVRVRGAIALRVRYQPVEGGAAGKRVFQAAFEQLAGAADRGGDPFQRLVLQGDGEAAQRRPGGNVAAHDPGTDHVEAIQREIRFLAEGLQPILEEEQAHQIAGCRRADDTVDQFRRGQRVATVSRPAIDDGVRGRIMFRPGAAGHLLARLAGDEAFERSVHQPMQ